MSADQTDLETPTDDPQADPSEEGQEEPQRLELKVQIENRSTCERHITVTVPRADIDRYFNDKFSEIMPTANVPGFRIGRAPRKLVENMYRKDVADQVKGSLLMDAVGQVTEEEKLPAISEPDFDPFAIVVPEDGDMTFEFNLEVRPEFDLPEWKGLKIERPVREITDADVDARLKSVLEERAELVPKDGAAQAADHITADILVRHGEEVVTEAEEEVICIRPTLSFQDGNIDKFDELMIGVKEGETRTAEMQLGEDAPNEELRGKKVTVEFKILAVQKMELPEMTPALLKEISQFSSEEELRAAVQANLQRQVDYEQQQRARGQITAALIKSADWDLPPDLLRRQANRELQRSVLELRSAGFSDAAIRAHENELRQNSQSSTARSLKEHFILERIAEDEGIEEAPGDFDMEIAMIAAQIGESPRRVRARFEKDGRMDSVRNQIIERKTINLILEHAKFNDVPFDLSAVQTEAIDLAAGGGSEDEDAIPSATEEGKPDEKREKESAKTEEAS